MLPYVRRSKIKLSASISLNYRLSSQMSVLQVLLKLSHDFRDAKFAHTECIDGCSESRPLNSNLHIRIQL